MKIGPTHIGGLESGKVSNTLF